MNFMDKIEKEAQKHFDRKGAHDFSHTRRVYHMAEIIAKSEKNVDMDVLRAAALLHDIARKKQDARECKCHADEGARMAPAILKKAGFPKEKISKVVYCIKIHRKSKNLKAETIEARILQDADRLDIFSAIGIVRTFMHHAKEMVMHSDTSRRLTSFEDYNTDSIFEYIRGIRFIKSRYFNTKKAKKILKKRLKFINEFIRQFEEEWYMKKL
jgi:uncharacterized protein